MKEISREDKVQEILEVVRQYSRGDFSKRIRDESGEDLMKDLARGINALGDSLEVLRSEHHAEMAKQEASLMAAQENSEEVFQEKTKYKSLIDNVKLGIYRSREGSNSGFIEVNPAMAQIFGFESREALLSEQPQKLWWNPADRLKLFKKVRKNSFVIREEVVLRKKGDIKIECALSVAAVLSKQGKVLFYDGVVEDITEQRNIESRLSQNAEILRNITKESQDMIFQLNQEGKFVYCSPYSEKILGLSCQQITESKIEDYLSGQEFLRVSKIFSEALSGEKVSPFELAVRHSNGKMVYLEVRFIPLTEINDIPVVQGIARNITEQKLSGQALKKERDYAETIRRIIPSGLFTVDKDLVVTSWNTMAAIITGYQPHEMIGEKCTVLQGDQSQKGFGFTSLDMEEPILGSICTIRTKTGETKTLRKNMDLIKNNEGEVIGGIESFEDISDLIETQRALEKESYLINTLLEHIPDRLYFKDLNSRFLRVSKSTAFHHGYNDPAELIGKSDEDLFSGQHSEAALLAEKQIIETGKPIIDIEERETWKEGRETCSLTSKMPMCDFEGKVVGTFGISSDITDRKQAEKELQRINDLLDVTGRMAKVGGWELDVKTLTVTWTAQTYSIHELSMDSDPGLQDAMQYYHPDDRPKLDKAIKRAITHGEPYNMEVRLITAKGKHLWIQTMCTPILKKGVTVKLRGTIQDVTEQRELREETKERQELLDKITGSAQDSIIVIDNHGNVVFWNKSAEKIFGYKEEEIAGKNFHNLMVRKEYHEAHKKGFEMFRKSGEGNAVGRTFELDALRKNGQNFPVELSMASVKIRGEWHAVGIIRDITERKESESKIEEARKKAESANQAKSEFLANMSHEIRTPMNAILGFSEILEDQLRDEPLHYEHIKGIRNSGKGLLGLINDILDLSKIEAGKLDINYETLNPYSIIEEIRMIFQAKTTRKNLDFQINVDPDLPNCLLVDETRLRQVLFNLIGNAVKFTSDGGVTVNVKSKDSNDDQSHVDIFIEVIDTGIGIPEKDLVRIFEPFRQKEGQSTRKYGGTGLGLSITQRLVGMMGGKIEVSSIPEKGSTFTVHLPGVQVAVMSDTVQHKEEALGKVVFENQTILLVEDIDSNRKVITGYLGEKQINIKVAENGSVGVDLAQELLPDLILMDMQMPVMDGYEATRLIKANDQLKHIPVIALTASTMKSDEKKIRNLCDGYLRKPVTRAQLISELKKFLTHGEDKRKEDSEQRKSPGQPGQFFSELMQRMSLEPGLAEELSLDFHPEIYKEFRVLYKSRSNKKIRYFADLVSSYGRKKGMEEFDAYGKELHQQLGAFDMKLINSMLEEFARLSEQIEAIHTKTKSDG